MPATFPNDAVRRTVFAGLVVCALLAAALGLTAGALPITTGELIATLAAPFERSGGPVGSVVWDLRMPRVLLALLVGSSLACAGAAMQGLFRNPLADPGLVGVSSGAALAAVAVIVGAAHLPALTGQWLALSIPVAAFLGGLAAAALATALASVDGETRPATLLLAGLAINAIAGAGIGLLMQVSGDAALREATFWLFGSLSKSGWTELGFAAPILIGVLVLLGREARALNTLLLGDAEAAHLGVDVDALRRRVSMLIVLAVAVCVALTGIIGFVGLVVPHLLRLVLGPDHRGLLPGAALGGAVLLLIADLAARSLLAPVELPIGVLTALVGGPFFLVLLIRQRDRIEAW